MPSSATRWYTGLLGDGVVSSNYDSPVIKPSAAKGVFGNPEDARTGNTSTDA